MKLIPELRFPEFENKEWNVSPIDDYCDVFRGSTFSKSDINKGGSEPCIHYGELFTKYNEVIYKIYSRTDKQDGFKSEAGDVLMPSSDVTPDGLARASAITLDNVILGGDMNILRPYKGINSIFLSYLLNHSKREIIKLVSGTTVKHIYPSQIITCELPIIDNEVEQQKIASCLSSLDELIAAHNDKLDALKDHKKGLLQNLFPQEGETVPKVRFSEFEGDGEWEVAENSVKITSGNAYKMSLYSDVGLRLVQGANILNGVYSDQNSSYINPNDVIDQKNVIVQKGDVLIGLNRPITNNELKVCRYPYESGYLYQRAGKLETNAKIIEDFLFQFLCTPLFLERLKKELVGSDQPYIKSNLFSTDIIIAPGRKEQQKIASCLSAVDELITAQQEKIEQLQQHKKGLMQGLFPKIES